MDQVEVPVENHAVESSAATKKTTKPEKKPHGRDLPDSMSVARRARYHSVKGRVWAMLHECVDRAEMKEIVKNHAPATKSGNDVLILGCAVHPECMHFFRARDLKNDYYSIEQSGVHTYDRGVVEKKKSNSADWKPIEGCDELTLEECSERLQGHVNKSHGGRSNYNYWVYECQEHAECDHRMQRRKYKGSLTYALLEDGAHNDGSTGLAGRIACSARLVGNSSAPVQEPFFSVGGEDKTHPLTNIFGEPVAEPVAEPLAETVSNKRERAVIEKKRKRRRKVHSTAPPEVLSAAPSELALFGIYPRSIEDRYAWQKRESLRIPPGLFEAE